MCVCVCCVLHVSVWKLYLEGDEVELAGIKAGAEAGAEEYSYVIKHGCSAQGLVPEQRYHLASMLACSIVVEL